MFYQQRYVAHHVNVIWELIGSKRFSELFGERCNRYSQLLEVGYVGVDKFPYLLELLYNSDHQICPRRWHQRAQDWLFQENSFHHFLSL